MAKWIAIALVIGLCGVLWADAKSDLDSAKRDYESVKSKYDDQKSRVESYLEQSRGLRSFDKDKLNSLIEMLCKQDVEPNDRDVDDAVKSLVQNAVDSVQRNYSDTLRTAMDRVGGIERILEQAKAVRNRAKDLKSQDAVKDDASRLTDDAQRLADDTDRLMEKVQSDLKSLDNVKQGTMNGANNPTIRAKMEYGKEKHKDLQNSYSCDEREVVVSSGRPDCVKFTQDDCQIIEFKPDTWSTGQAESQARQYLDDVRRKFKDDDRAKKCKQVDGLPFFRTVGVTYSACRS
ncbi:MAG: hypothetical protein KF773_32430 [Deltaproteobacteria bacterium]|nr:hypothetical protein [Deltaproteobacteria bacterium]